MRTPATTNFNSVVLEDGFYLPRVIDVMPCKHTHYLLDRFWSSFGVHSTMLPLLRFERLKQSKIRFAQHAK